MSSALTGDVIYSDGCSTENKAFLEQTVLYGRIVAASAAYDECISQAVTGTV